MKARKYTDRQLEEAVRCSQSIRQVMTKLGFVEAGGNYQSIAKRIKTLNLDNSHFRGQAWRKGLDKPPKAPKPLSDILQTNTVYRSSLLRERLISEGYKPRKCENCGRASWVGKIIPLELHHNNGDKSDNRIENLQLYCPNCHALTESYRGKAIRKV